MTLALALLIVWLLVATVLWVRWATRAPYRDENRELISIIDRRE